MYQKKMALPPSLISSIIPVDWHQSRPPTYLSFSFSLIVSLYHLLVYRLRNQSGVIMTIDGVSLFYLWMEYLLSHLPLLLLLDLILLLRLKQYIFTKKKKSHRHGKNHDRGNKSEAPRWFYSSAFHKKGTYIHVRLYSYSSTSIALIWFSPYLLAWLIILIAHGCVY